MPKSDNLARQLQRAIESLMEDERLRSHLTDDEAKALLSWAEKQLEQAASAAGLLSGDAAQESFDATRKRVRASLRAINDLMGDRDSLSDSQMKQRLEEIVFPEGQPTGVMAAIADPLMDVVAQRARLSGPELIQKITGLLTLADQVQRGDLVAAGRGIAAAVQKAAAPVTAKTAGKGPSIGLIIGGVILLLLCCLVIAGALLLQGYNFLAPGLNPPVTSPTAAPASWYQVYFTTPRYPDNLADHRGGLDEKLTAFINTARSSVDIAIYQLDLKNVTQALLDAKKRGCAVRVVTDIDDVLDEPKENAAFKQLQAAGITVIGGNPDAIMHNKFVVVDNKAVWTGSWNFTDNDTYRYNNNGIQIQSSELAKNYTVTFEKMFKDQKFGPSRKPGGTTPRLTISGVTVENYFAPEDNVAEKIVARLKTAQKTIDFMAFSFTDDAIGETVRARARAGVKVRGVFENTGSETKYSEYGRMKDDRLDVWQDGNPYLMHHKVFIVDGKTVIFGSFNFSQNAEESNDENLLIIDDAGLAAQFTAEFERVYAQAKNPPKK